MHYQLIMKESANGKGKGASLHPACLLAGFCPASCISTSLPGRHGWRVGGVSGSEDAKLDGMQPGLLSCLQRARKRDSSVVHGRARLAKGPNAPLGGSEVEQMKHAKSRAEEKCIWSGLLVWLGNNGLTRQLSGLLVWLENNGLAGEPWSRAAMFLRYIMKMPAANTRTSAPPTPPAREGASLAQRGQPGSCRPQK